MIMDIWEGAILGAILGSLVIPGVLKAIGLIGKWWKDSRPARKLLQGIADEDEKCKVFVRDFFITKGAELYSIEPRLGIGKVPNVHELWPAVEGRAVGNLFSIFGQIGKTKNVDVVRMSQDAGDWNCNVIVLGAQAKKCFDFYMHMKNVAYRVDGENIYDNTTNEIISREDGYGYGIILKAQNPFKTDGRKGIGLLIGGFGVLGTAVASYYFKENFRQLGKEFKKDFFGIVIRASVSAGEQAVERLSKHDKVFNS